MIRTLSFSVASWLAISAVPALSAEILIHDAKSQPESLSIAANGDLYVGSASSPFVYRVKKGSTTAEQFIDASAEGPGTFFFGQLVDNAANTLWTCQLTPVAGVTPVQRHTALPMETRGLLAEWDATAAIVFERSFPTRCAK